MTGTIAIPLAGVEAHRMCRAVDGRAALAIPGGVRVMAKLARLAQGTTVHLNVNVDELELVCEFAHDSGCAPSTTANLDAVLQEFCR